MKVNGQAYRTIWLKEGDDNTVQIIDQRVLPHEFKIVNITTAAEAAWAIKDMVVRGAPLIGGMAGYGMYLATLEMQQEQKPKSWLEEASEMLYQTRPTAVNLPWALNRMRDALSATDNPDEIVAIALQTAKNIVDEDVDICFNIGQHGLPVIEKLSAAKNGETVNILTHCNAGWLATIDWGTATSPIYQAFNKGIKVHVWVDETRPRNQGSHLTAWELGQHGVPHTVITDNTGGHLMQHGMVDMVITGTDRTTAHGDVANKIGTYLKALAAKDNNIPFYIGLPSPSIDWTIGDGVKEIPIEMRSEEEVKYIQGWHDGAIKKVLITPEKSPAANYGFDVTPARLITGGLITERGICEASADGLARLFPEKKVVLQGI